MVAPSGHASGGPLSPLLANVVLDEVDKALEARGYSFARYADDCNVYVGSKGLVSGSWPCSGSCTRAQASNQRSQSAVTSALGQIPGLRELWVAKGKEVKCAVAQKALDNFKARIRQLTRRSGGRSMAQVVQKLRSYLLGWKAYFRMAQTPKVWRELDEWLRHRLRLSSSTLETAQGDLSGTQGAGGLGDVAKQVAGNCHRWWRNSDRGHQTVVDHCVL